MRYQMEWRLDFCARGGAARDLEQPADSGGDVAGHNRDNRCLASRKDPPTPVFLGFVCKHLSATENQVQPRQLEAIWPALRSIKSREVPV
jgi:hypothetical protein